MILNEILNTHVDLIQHFQYPKWRIYTKVSILINPLRGGGAEAPRPQSAVEARASIQGVDGVLGELQSFLFSLDVRKRWNV